MHEPVNIHILLLFLWGYLRTVVCEMCLVRMEESVLLQVVCTGPHSPVCVAHFELHKKVFCCSKIVVQMVMNMPNNKNT